MLAVNHSHRQWRVQRAGCGEKFSAVDAPRSLATSRPLASRRGLFVADSHRCGFSALRILTAAGSRRCKFSPLRPSALQILTTATLGGSHRCAHGHGAFYLTRRAAASLNQPNCHGGPATLDQRRFLSMGLATPHCYSDADNSEQEGVDDGALDEAEQYVQAAGQLDEVGDHGAQTQRPCRDERAPELGR
jgi:hypothetical protein